MHFRNSCIATFPLLQSGITIYIANRDKAIRPDSSKGDGAMLLAILRAIREFRDYHRNLNELSNLSERDLADIGLSYSDIDAVAAGTYRR